MSQTQRKIFTSLAMLLIVAACSKESSTSSTTSNNVGTTTGSTSGGTTTGSTTGGTTDSSIGFNVVMAGGQTWMIGAVPSGVDTNPSSAGYTQGDFIAIDSNNAPFFFSDYRYKVRVKAKAQPTVTSNTNKKWCYGRLYPSSQTANYTKLSFSVGIVDIYDNGGTYSTSAPYSVKTVSELSVDSYSSVLNWNKGQIPGRNLTGGNLVGHGVAVFNVMSDSACVHQGSSVCKSGTAYYPVSTHPNTGCWNLQVEIATDSTDDF